MPFAAFQGGTIPATTPATIRATIPESNAGSQRIPIVPLKLFSKLVAHGVNFIVSVHSVDPHPVRQAFATLLARLPNNSAEQFGGTILSSPSHQSASSLDSPFVLGFRILLEPASV